jgi:hypothetical protein
MNFLLKIVEGPNKGAEIALVEGVAVTFGKTDDCDIMLADATFPDSPVRLEASTTIIGEEADGYKSSTIKGGSEGGITIANGATVTFRNVDLSFYNADPSYCINGVASSSTNPDDWATLIIENSKVNAKSEMVTDNWCICNLKHLTVNNSFVNLYGYEAIHNLQSFTKGEGMTTMLSKIHRAYFYAPDMNFSTRPNVSSPSTLN